MRVALRIATGRGVTEDAEPPLSPRPRYYGVMMATVATLDGVVLFDTALRFDLDPPTGAEDRGFLVVADDENQAVTLPRGMSRRGCTSPSPRAAGARGRCSPSRGSSIPNPVPPPSGRWRA